MYAHGLVTKHVQGAAGQERDGKGAACICGSGELSSVGALYTRQGQDRPYSNAYYAHMQRRARGMLLSLSISCCLDLY